ncbi:MAG: right-handed parallel beta-helix repeat-containing protein [Pseudomonadota bacterium]
MSASDIHQTPATLALPQEISLAGRRVELFERVAESQTSTVFKGREVSGDAPVAVKIFAEAEVAEREGDLLKVLAGQPVAQLLSAGSFNGDRVLLTAWVEGERLSQSMPAVSAEKRREAMLALARSLDALHGAGVLHRDLKPEHVLITEDGEAILTDFSAARHLDAAPGVGADDLTPETAAPEQLAGEAEGVGTDIYGFGVVLFWVVTGQLPKDAAQVTDDPAVTFARECMAPNPADRPQSARALIERLDGLDFAGQAVQAADPFPETVRIRTRQPGVRPEPPAVAALPPRARRKPPYGRIAVFLLFAGGLAALSYMFVWPFYERYYKIDWVIDPTGGGDAITLAEVLDRGGRNLRIRLTSGNHVFAEIADRTVEIAPIEGLDEPPVIVASGESCLELINSVVRIENLMIDGSGGGEGRDCLIANGGALTLAGVRIDDPTGAGFVATGGARVAAEDLQVSGSQAAGVLLQGGVVLEAASLSIEQPRNSGLMLRGGAEASIEGLEIKQAGAAGIAIGGGAVARIQGAQVEATVGSGIDIAEGAVLTLNEARLSGSAGAGIAIYDGGSGALSSVEISSAALTGLFVEDATALQLTDVSIAGNAEHGALLLSLDAGRLDGVSITGNKGAGLVIFPDVTAEIGETDVTGNEGGDVIDGRPPPAPDEPAEEEKEE